MTIRTSGNTPRSEAPHSSASEELTNEDSRTNVQHASVEEYESVSDADDDSTTYHSGVGLDDNEEFDVALDRLIAEINAPPAVTKPPSSNTRSTTIDNIGGQANASPPTQKNIQNPVIITDLPGSTLAEFNSPGPGATHSTTDSVKQNGSLQSGALSGRPDAGINRNPSMSKVPVAHAAATYGPAKAPVTTRYNARVDGTDTPDSGNSEIDTDEDDDDSEDLPVLTKNVADQVLECCSEAKKLAKKLPANDPNRARLENMLAESEAITRKIADSNAHKRPQPLPLDHVVKRLENAAKTFASLQQGQYQLQAKHATGQQPGNPDLRSILPDGSHNTDSDIDPSDVGDGDSAAEDLNNDSGAGEANDAHTVAAVANSQALSRIDSVIHVIKQGQDALVRFSLPTEEHKNELAEIITKTEAMLETLKADKNAFPGMKADELADALDSQLLSLQQLDKEFQQYGGEGPKNKMLDGRVLYADAAIMAFDSMIVAAKTKGMSAKRQTEFERDAQELRRIVVEHRMKIQAKKISQPGSIAAPSRQITQIQPSARVSGILKKQGDNLVETKPGPLKEKQSFAKLIDDFLELYPEADSRSGRRMLADYKSAILNEKRDWQIIESTVLVPLKKSASYDNPSRSSPDGSRQEHLPATTLAAIKSVTSPVGHIFNHPSLTVDSNDSAIQTAILSEYRIKDPNALNDPAKTITTGRNSHSSIEHLHGVNVARTEASTDEKKLFTGTRHATLSPYDLCPDRLKKADPAVLQKMAADLLQQGSGITRISTGWPASGTSQRASGAAGPAPLVNTNASPTELEQTWANAVAPLDDNAFIAKLTKEDKFCALVRRKAALNRAREVFLSEALGNEGMLAQIRAGNPISFNSISLITPDLFRHFLAKLMPSKHRSSDELSMRREELQAWRDLEEEIAAGKLVIDGQVVKAKIISFSVGVNALALGDGTSISRSLLSGWNQVTEDNRKALTELIGDPKKVAKADPEFNGQVAEKIRQLRTEIDQENSTLGNSPQIPKSIADKKRQILVIEQLAKQLADMWIDGSYRRIGDQPYKFAARLALLSSLLNGGTAFNCRSGKDRTAQLDLEAKLLAIQIESRHLGAFEAATADGSVRSTNVPPPYAGRTDFERYQLQHLVFGDKSRTEMQRYNTGVEGSKLKAMAVIDTFAPADADNRDTVRAEFIGRAYLA